MDHSTISLVTFLIGFLFLTVALFLPEWRCTKATITGYDGVIPPIEEGLFWVVNPATKALEPVKRTTDRNVTTYTFLTGVTLLLLSLLLRGTGGHKKTALALAVVALLAVTTANIYFIVQETGSSRTQYVVETGAGDIVVESKVDASWYIAMTGWFVLFVGVVVDLTDKDFMLMTKGKTTEKKKKK